MGVAVQGADRPLLKVQLTEHQVIIVGEDLACHALACPLSLDGLAKDKICSLHLVVLLMGMIGHSLQILEKSYK